jgi:hypothetical protein
MLLVWCARGHAGDSQHVRTCTPHERNPRIYLHKPCAGVSALLHEPRTADAALQGFTAGAPGDLLASGHTSAAAVDEAGDLWVATEVVSAPTLYCTGQARCSAARWPAFAATPRCLALLQWACHTVACAPRKWSCACCVCLVVVLCPSCNSAACGGGECGAARGFY